ncbi:MAG TPA: flavin reductase family protein [Pseudogracilibacillus sp.]|nr:flavin reductase family protein [Pseudogracilibacillus sp.]
MLNIDPNDQTERENYKLMTGTIIPRPIAFVTSVNNEGVINGAPFSYFNIVTADPPMISLSIQRKDGQQKDTVDNILQTKEFVIHIVDEHNVEEINKSAANLAREESELDKMNVQVVNSKAVKVPGIKEAKVRFECQLEKHIPLGDKEVTTDLIIGRILQYHIDPSIYADDGKIKMDQLKAVSRLAGNNYAKVGEHFTLVRPQ